MNDNKVLLTGDKGSAYSLAALHKVAGKDDDRPVMTAIHYDTARGVLEAVNGFTSLTVPAFNTLGENRVHTADGSPLPSKFTLQSVPRKQDSFYVEAVDPEGMYPDLGVLPPAGEPAFEIAFDSRLLADLLSAIGEHMTEGPNRGSAVRFRFYGPTKVAEVIATEEDRKAYGLIMPRHIDKDREPYEPYGKDDKSKT